MSLLKGIFCPNIVPFHEDGSIHEGELRRIVNWLLDKGIQGLYPNGSTGEFIRLSLEERQRVVEIIADEAGGRVPILAGAAEGNIDLVLRAAARYADLGCRAISVTGPYFYKVSPESIETYFRELARRSPIDIILYNIPQFSNEIPVDVITRLALDCPRIAGVKDSSRDMPRFLSTLNKVKPQRPDFTCLVGCEEILFPTLLMGGDGGTIASSGVIPEAIVKIYDAFTREDYDECKRLQFKILELIESMLQAGNFPEGFRAGVALRGFKPGPPRQPMSAQETEHLETVRSHMACILSDCGHEEAAAYCEKQPAPLRLDVDKIVKEVLTSMQDK